MRALNTRQDQATPARGDFNMEQLFANRMVPRAWRSFTMKAGEMTIRTHDD